MDPRVRELTDPTERFMVTPLIRCAGETPEFAGLQDDPQAGDPLVGPPKWVGTQLKG